MFYKVGGLQLWEKKARLYVCSCQHLQHHVMRDNTCTWEVNQRSFNCPLVKTSGKCFLIVQ